MDAKFCQFFFCIHQNGQIVFFFSLMICLFMLTDIWIPLNQPWINSLNNTWSWCINLFTYGWTSFTNVLLWTFAPIFMRDTGCFFSSFLFLPYPCYKGLKQVEKVSSSFIFFKFVQNWYFFFIWYSIPVK